MLELRISSPELWDESTETFIEGKEWTLKLEHSLVSISKWESKYCKPFISKTEKSGEELIDYIKFMTLNKQVDQDVYNHITVSDIEKINKYIEAPMTATTISKSNQHNTSREVVTSELIYYWMIAMNIPLDECQKWHLNRLLTLIEVCNIKNSPPKKMSQRDVASRYRAINEMNRKRFNSKG